MICHLAVFHPPDLLQIRVLTDNPEDPNWAWLKWLPHVQHQTDTDAAGATRLVFTRPDGLSDLTARGPHTADCDARAVRTSSSSTSPAARPDSPSTAGPASP